MLIEFLYIGTAVQLWLSALLYIFVGWYRVPVGYYGTKLSIQFFMQTGIMVRQEQTTDSLYCL